MKTIRICIAVILSALSAGVYAQRSERGTPPSFQEGVVTNDYPVITMPSMNFDSIQRADDEVVGSPIRPYKYGHAFDTNIDLLASGEWTGTEGGTNLQTENSLLPCASPELYL